MSAIEKGTKPAAPRKRAEGRGVGQGGYSRRPEPTPEANTVYLTILIIIFIAASAWFWKRHDQFLSTCMKRGHTFETCWNLLR